MRVDPKDGVCRSCKGELEIIDADDATMTVETDAFGDGCVIYYVGFMAQQMEAANDEP
ncbi:MAG: hypothetical protein JXA33_12280 [Anaerolineae bacterium]|nr:hypothetical protein [Anaerolineae bacterium]